MLSLESFRQAAHTVPNEDRNFTSWHRGRPWYYFWNVAITDPAWCAQTSAAACWLGDYLIPDYHRQPHITLLPWGFAPLTPWQNERAIALAVARGSFNVRLGTLCSFTSSACFAIESGDRLSGLRAALMNIQSDTDEQVDDGAYDPHLTVGLYRDSFGTARVAKRIGDFPPYALPSLRVDRFLLSRYDTTSVKGAIETVAEFELGEDGVVND